MDPGGWVRFPSPCVRWALIYPGLGLNHVGAVLYSDALSESLKKSRGINWLKLKETTWLGDAQYA